MPYPSALVYLVANARGYFLLVCRSFPDRVAFIYYCFFFPLHLAGFTFSLFVMTGLFSSPRLINVAFR